MPPVPAVDPGNNAWVLLSAALIMFMTVPALALFYGGLVRRKNVLSIMMHSMAPLVVVSLVWVTVGYSLAFSDTELIPGVLGDLKWAFLSGISPLDPSPYVVSDPSRPVSHLAFIMFQCMFAVITPAVVSGAFAERMRFPSFLAFCLAWMFLIYIPLAHMVWSKGGFLAGLGTIDYAGGLVVEINSGFSALAAALVIGKRTNHKGSPPHNLTLTLVGAGMLWFGWFGFNAGSGLAADGLAASAFMTTNTAAAAAALAWAALDWILQKKPTILGVASGSVAGLVAITPAAGFVGIGGALAIGLLAGLVCHIMVMYGKSSLGYDDSLDAFGVHGIAGLIGTLGVGIFADPFITRGFLNDGKGYAGLLSGNPALLLSQVQGVLLTVALAFAGTFLIFKVIDLTMGLRVGESEEAMGLDIVEHNERAYTILE